MISYIYKFTLFCGIGYILNVMLYIMSYTCLVKDTCNEEQNANSRCVLVYGVGSILLGFIHF